jgi:hypothetical protein
VDPRWLQNGPYLVGYCNADVSELMGEADEGLWQEVGLFKNIDTLGCIHSIRLLSLGHLLLLLVPLAEFLVLRPRSQFIYLVCRIPSRRRRSFALGAVRGLKTEVVVFLVLAERLLVTALSPRKCHREWKSNKVVKRMVLGSDIGLEETCRMALCGLVGRFSYGNLCKETLHVWVEQVWSSLLGYTPEVLYLSKGWFGFLCKSPEDVSLLLENMWVNGGSSLMLKRWRWPLIR